jgi:hypothetical protein
MSEMDEKVSKWAELERQFLADQEFQRKVAKKRADKAFNKGLLEGLGWKIYLYPFLKR